MKLLLSKPEAKERIDSFFSGNNFSSAETKKIRRMAMKHKIKLKNYRKLFCKKCLSKLKGKTRISRTHKTIECQSCGFRNKFRI